MANPHLRSGQNEYEAWNREFQRHLDTYGLDEPGSPSPVAGNKVRADLFTVGIGPCAAELRAMDEADPQARIGADQLFEDLFGKRNAPYRCASWFANSVGAKLRDSAG